MEEARGDAGLSESNLELAREGFSLWVERDVERLIALSTDDFEFVPAIAAGVEGGSVRGPEQVRRFFTDFDQIWETFRVDAIEFRDLGDCVMTTGQLTAKGRGSELELDHPIYMVIRFRDGKFARMQSFLDREAAVISAQESARTEATG